MKYDFLVVCHRNRGVSKCHIQTYVLHSEFLRAGNKCLEYTYRCYQNERYSCSNLVNTVNLHACTMHCCSKDVTIVDWNVLDYIQGLPDIERLI